MRTYIYFFFFRSWFLALALKFHFLIKLFFVKTFASNFTFCNSRAILAILLHWNLFMYNVLISFKDAIFTFSQHDADNIQHVVREIICFWTKFFISIYQHQLFLLIRNVLIFNHSSRRSFRFPVTTVLFFKHLLFSKFLNLTSVNQHSFLKEHSTGNLLPILFDFGIWMNLLLPS